MKKSIVIGICSVLLGIMVAGCGAPKPNQNINTLPATNTLPASENTNTPSVKTQTNVSTNAQTDTKVRAKGKVFVKGYGTPSESYGILSNEGLEIGFGKYDSSKEEFRAYVGDQLEVTFSSVCKTGESDCCRTLFPYCGTVVSWKPVP